MKYLFENDVDTLCASVIEFSSAYSELGFCMFKYTLKNKGS